MTILPDDAFAELLRIRAEEPGRLFAAAEARRRRPLVAGDGRLLIVALDHPARRIVGAGDDPRAMVDRREALTRCLRALSRPGVDGLLATPDILEDLLLLGALEDKLAIGSMNRSGLTGSAWELDDRMTGYSAATIGRLGLDGGKMLLRLDYDDVRTNDTISACAEAVDALAASQLMAMIEPLPAYRDDDGRVRISSDPALVEDSILVAQALGAPSVFTWLKLPTVADPAGMVATTTMPVLLLGGDAGPDGAAVLQQRWRDAMALPQVRGLTVGRSLLYPGDGDVERAVDAAVAIVHGDAA